MIRDDRLVLSRRQYAVDLTSLDLMERTFPEGSVWYGTVRAVWFRRRKGVTVACVGALWDFQHHKPLDVPGFLAVHDDGRHGGNCEARWDGRKYWDTDGRPETHVDGLALLRPMLDNYPDVPRGFDGWWRF